MYNEIYELIISYSDKEIAKEQMRFFKTGKGEYGEGDLFFGINIPKLREISKKYWKLLSLNDCKKLLKNKYHEVRLVSLFILILKYDKNDNEKEEIFNIYLNNIKYINNWDLVDLSAPNIIGSYIYNNNKHNVIYELIDTKRLWETRIAVLSTLYLIRNKEFEDIIKVSKLLLNYNHDLIHKAVGWMLREAGKRDKNVLINFLEEHSKIMPRTMLRYSIEKLSVEERVKYMTK